MKELKEQIIEAVQDATDAIDGTVSILILDHFLDGILTEQLSQPCVMRRLPTSEDVKRWHALLVGQGNEAMQKDIEATFA